MKIVFTKGCVQEEGGDLRSAIWVETPFGVFGQFKGDVSIRKGLDLNRLEPEKLAGAVDLQGLEEGDLLFVISRIIETGCLDKPGADKREDAALYALVNEALKEIDKAEALLKRLDKELE